MYNRETAYSNRSKIKCKILHNDDDIKYALYMLTHTCYFEKNHASNRKDTLTND